MPFRSLPSAEKRMSPDGHDLRRALRRAASRTCSSPDDRSTTVATRYPKAADSFLATIALGSSAFGFNASDVLRSTRLPTCARIGHWRLDENDGHGDRGLAARPGARAVRAGVPRRRGDRRRPGRPGRGRPREARAAARPAQETAAGDRRPRGGRLRRPRGRWCPAPANCTPSARRGAAPADRDVRRPGRLDGAERPARSRGRCARCSAPTRTPAPG